MPLLAPVTTATLSALPCHAAAASAQPQREWRRPAASGGGARNARHGSAFNAALSTACSHAARCALAMPCATHRRGSGASKSMGSARSREPGVVCVRTAPVGCMKESWRRHAFQTRLSTETTDMTSTVRLPPPHEKRAGRAPDVGQSQHARVRRPPDAAAARASDARAVTLSHRGGGRTRHGRAAFHASGRFRGRSRTCCEAPAPTQAAATCTP